MAQSLGRNIKIIDKEDYFLIKISKKRKLIPAKSGYSQILASTNKFESVDLFLGKELKDKEIGLSLTISVRDKKEDKSASKTQATASSKRA